MATFTHTIIASGVDWRTIAIVASPLWIIIATVIYGVFSGEVQL